MESEVPLLGSVRRHRVQHARCPVLIVRHAHNETAGPGR